MKREAVDFHLIPASQEAIHIRLLNWGRWCHPSARGTAPAPMFQNYRSTDLWAEVQNSSPLDSVDAGKIEKAVRLLPEKYPEALRWHYVKSGPPIRCARALGITLENLARLVLDGRSMLINRRA